MRAKIRAFLLRQSFFPDWLGIFVNPFYFARSGLAAGIRKYSNSLDGVLLDVGCGTKPYQALFSVEKYIGLDIDSDSSRMRAIADYFYDGATFPFSDEMFDSILCNQVLEHVFNPDYFLSEIYRVMKPGAKMLLTVPFVWDEHEHPYDYARYSSFGLKSLFERNKFKILMHDKLGADSSILCQLANAYLYKIAGSSNKYVQYFVMIFIMGPLNLLGLLARRVLPRNPDLFLDHIFLVEKSL
jgi:SAM-dependent methyltransferase